MFGPSRLANVLAQVTRSTPTQRVPRHAKARRTCAKHVCTAALPFAPSQTVSMTHACTVSPHLTARATHASSRALLCVARSQRPAALALALLVAAAGLRRDVRPWRALGRISSKWLSGATAAHSRSHSGTPLERFSSVRYRAPHPPTVYLDMRPPDAHARNMCALLRCHSHHPKPFP